LKSLNKAVHTLRISISKLCVTTAQKLHRHSVDALQLILNRFATASELPCDRFLIASETLLNRLESYSQSIAVQSLHNRADIFASSLRHRRAITTKYLGKKLRKLCINNVQTLFKRL
jgi:hypothetical protein